MRDYKHSKVTEPLPALALLSGLCFGIFFYGFIFLLLSI